jgi:hypothetical protein
MFGHIESTINYRKIFDSYENRWEEIRQAVLLERKIDKSQTHDIITLIDQLSESSFDHKLF